jgi:hypothetical protein
VVSIKYYSNGVHRMYSQEQLNSILGINPKNKITMKIYVKNMGLQYLVLNCKEKEPIKLKGNQGVKRK